eukprot:TRINITY_DN10285_c0_g2_i2.p1 TRINITY_DN10285_c0_g2~~TRINITY_DN10285_c0_g2_i2.p1  ORF type:complete len:220 (-),score=17.05 TRINITY_DN10285_c0_g2_i2:181-840(-)
MNVFEVGQPSDPRMWVAQPIQWVQWVPQPIQSQPVEVLRSPPDWAFADMLRSMIVCLNWTDSHCSFAVGWDVTHLIGDFHENKVAPREVVAFEVKLRQYPRYTFEARRTEIHSRRDIACRLAIGGLGAVTAVGGAAAAVAAGAAAAEIGCAAAGGAVFLGEEYLNHRIKRIKKRGISGHGICLILQQNENGKLFFTERSIEQVLACGWLSEKTRKRMNL